MNDITLNTFKHRPDRGGRYEAYLQERHPYMVFTWCCATFGPMGERWDQCGNWYFIFNKSDVVWFVIKWGNNDNIR